MILRSLYLFGYLLFFLSSLEAQTPKDKQVVNQLFYESLTNSPAYDWLLYLCDRIGSRPSGSVSYKLANDYVLTKLDSLGVNKVYKQPVLSPKWVRGAPEFAYFEIGSNVTTSIPIHAWQGSVPTNFKGIKAKLIEVNTIEDFDRFTKKEVAQRIIFVNREMNPGIVYPDKAYEIALKEIHQCIQKAIDYGAMGIVVRSLTLLKDDIPHIEIINYEGIPISKRLSIASLSTRASDLLSSVLALNPNTELYYKQNCHQDEPVKTNNIIAELRGDTYPEKIILIGAHLDSIDIGDGAHDNAAGCVQAISVLSLLQSIGYKPKCTIRVVLFADGISAHTGVKTYISNSQSEQTLFAIDSHAGGFQPTGFALQCPDKVFSKIAEWETLWKSYGIYRLETSSLSPDMSFISKQSVATASLITSSQRYYDNHYSKRDIASTVNPRELNIGSAAIASLIYFIDQYGR